VELQTGTNPPSTVPDLFATAFTVNVAFVVVALPATFVNTAWYSLPFIATVVPRMVSVVDVAPDKFVNVPPPLVLTCHCTVGVGEPDAAAVNVAVAQAVTVTFVGLVVIVGAVFPAFTVKVAFVVVALPAALVKTA
jgi:hypothetical protein